MDKRTADLWTLTTLGTVALRLVSGGTPPTENQAYWAGSIPWVTGADFTDFGLGEFRRFVSEDAIKRTATNLIGKGALLIVTRTGVGKLAIAPCDIAISQDITGVYPDQNQVAVEFLYHRMRQGVEDLRKLNQGTSINGVVRKDLLNYRLDLPPLTQQHQIAEILSTVDRAIEQTEALIAKQQRIKTGLMQDLLTRGIDEHGNLRSEQTHQFKDSQLGRVPRGWHVQSLGVALHRARGHIQTGPFGSQLHAHEYVHEGIPVIMPQDIVDGSISIAMIARVPCNRADDLRRHRTEFNDVVFSRRGDLSRAAAIGEREVGWLCGTGCFLLRVSPDAIHAPWLVDAYRHHRVQQQIDANAIGSTMPSLNNSVMEQLTVAFPCIDEQRKIARRREELDATIRTLLHHLFKMRHIKTGLMQQLLTGKRRVTVNTA